MNWRNKLLWAMEPPPPDPDLNIKLGEDIGYKLSLHFYETLPDFVDDVANWQTMTEEQIQSIDKNVIVENIIKTVIKYVRNLTPEDIFADE